MSAFVAEVYGALIAAGAPEEKAKAADAAIPVVGDLVAKNDIGNIKAEPAEVNARMANEFKTLYRNLRLPASSCLPPLSSNPFPDVAGRHDIGRRERSNGAA